jgi:PAS domain S-box-containing protein
MVPSSSGNRHVLSLNLAQQLLRYAPVAIAMLDTDINYVTASQRWLEDCAIEGDLTVHSHLEVVNHHAGEWPLLYQRCLQEQRPICREEFTQLSPRTTGWLQWEIVPWFERDSTLGGLLVTRTDITAQKRAASSQGGTLDTNSLEAALANSEAKFQRLIEAANDLIYMVGLDGAFTYLSPQFKAMWGYELEDFAGKSFAEIVHPEDMQRVMLAAQHVMQTGQPDTGLEFRTQRQDGSWCWIVCNSSPIFDH